MPQMAPLSWFSLFLFFVITFLLFNILNYFLYPATPSLAPATHGVLNSSPFNWKW